MSLPGFTDDRLWLQWLNNAEQAALFLLVQQIVAKAKIDHDLARKFCLYSAKELAADREMTDEEGNMYLLGKYYQGYAEHMKATRENEEGPVRFARHVVLRGERIVLGEGLSKEGEVADLMGPSPECDLRKFQVRLYDNSYVTLSVADNGKTWKRWSEWYKEKNT